MAKLGAVKSDEEVPKAVLNIVDPSIYDDETAGHTVSEIWVNSATDQTFVCVDTATGAAVWKKLTDQGGGTPSWGAITGTLSAQTDLAGALNGKETANANIQTHVTSQHAPANAQANADIAKAEIEAKLTGQITSHSHAGGAPEFPVGWVLISVVNTNPATFLGYGTWANFGAGRVLVGLDNGDSDFNVVEETGGSKTNTPSAHAGTAVGNHVFTQPGAHANHVFTQPANHTVTQPTAHGTLTHTTAADSTTSGGTAKVVATTHTLTNNHAGTAVSAHASGAVDAHSAHSGGAVDAHSVTQPSAHAALSVVQPYFVVYFWERTA